ncbi:hypothetical protein DRP07_03815 [Archaeoglobales archaeon]|nr:MAG: hypothetical protein DRP07_03815 [Archaeoglobales archaeon]
MNQIYDFIKKYYIDSLVYKQGYNIVNTITFAIILILAVILIYKFLRKYIEFDFKFVAGNVPFILLGSSARVIEDAGFLKPPMSYVFMTPFIYILIFLIAFPTLMVFVKLKKDEYWKYYGGVGLVLSLLCLTILFTNLEVVNGWLFPAVLFFSVIFTVAYQFIFERVYPAMNNWLSKTVFFAHMIDGFATFLGIQFLGYWELHVLPRFLINTLGPWVMIPAKIAVFVTVLYILDSSEEEENFKNFIKFILVVLGLAPGIRDSLRMVLST